VQGLVAATDSIRDTLIKVQTGSATIGIRAFRLEVMAELLEDYLSTMMRVRGMSMT
jgi:hypothetical protein